MYRISLLRRLRLVVILLLVFSVSPPVAVAAPDLVDGGEPNCFSPINASRGETLAVSCQIRNQNIVPILDNAGEFNVFFYASDNTIISTFDYYLGFAYVPSLAAGATVEVSANVTIPNDIPLLNQDGDYYVGWIIDPQDLVPESNEFNNTGYDDDTMLDIVPQNDECEDAFVVTEGLTYASNVGAMGESDGDGRNDVWFRYGGPPAYGLVTIDTCMSDFDTILYVRDQACDVPEEENDDGCTNGNTRTSLLTLCLDPNQTQYILVGGWNGDSGNIVLSITYAGLLSEPTGVAASNGDYCGKVRVSWNAVAGAACYTVFRDTFDAFCGNNEIATDCTSPYDDFDVDPDTTYYYWIKAANACGISGCSNWNTGYASCSPVCGNGNCDTGENCATCPQDCGSCPTGACCFGGAPCQANMTQTNCQAAGGNWLAAGSNCNQCPATCGDHMCNGSENCATCPQDCGPCPTGACCFVGAPCQANMTQTNCQAAGGDWLGTGSKCNQCPATCGDNVCNGGETCATCPQDCGCPPGQECVGDVCQDIPTCPNGTCDSGEDPCNCPQDCGSPPSSEANCSDGVDNDCDGAIDCDDPDCAAACPDCPNGTCDPAENPCNCPQDCGTPPSNETNCSDGVDNDCDGAIDCDDSDCATACPDCPNGTCDPGENPCNCPDDCGGPAASETNCSDGIDNDCDGFVDCDDRDCEVAQASSPSPSNGASGVSTGADLNWPSASGATSYDVYFGIDSTPDSGEFQDNTGSSFWSLGTLAENTTHHWRIDSVNSCGTTTGAVWSFTTTSPCNLPAQASSPSPSHGASGVSTSADLDWASASGATSYVVYFGTDPTPDNSERQGNAVSSFLALGALTENTTYYWRINTGNSCGATTGKKWWFTTRTDGSVGGPGPITITEPGGGPCCGLGMLGALPFMFVILVRRKLFAASAPSAGRDCKE